MLSKVEDVESVIKDNSKKSTESTKYIREVASSSEEQLSSIQDITTLIEETALLAGELSGLLKRFKL
ncbi:hypothetical protein FS935_19960 [Metabacillus litoralis]|uniref:Methyl-accepting chemotaxis protein n=1 Tax=Metabacillus litoralis TaxID=152268 RepID=A0A5C6VLC5_9BACI|nr:hypothetical protein [Metabacillus litoralis]TXC85779.1 hypothetical protein FS935_19960 [Metabacillus litoralis]